ncbi:cation diffusion facilitator family transporter [Lacticaseibacillus zhaodongensis]|uniref:cation diffusion facilitator family transporter n=1 Tax=Lacticaseibacillus zhaodongensis TaxID=2668065 RepID=UPI0012D34A0D|nr:cation diffusion facilitator family transporter [Lacticaseibacillus zhaodongensis]
MHEHPTNRRAFSLGMAINTVYVIIEATVGLLIGSVALVADALHNLSDVLSLALSWLADKLTHRSPTLRRTYGMKGGSILAALINAFILLVGMAAIIIEAIGRFRNPGHVAGTPMMIVAGVGILINGGTALLFMHGRQGDLNIRSAFLHMAADAGVSAAVVVAGFIMNLTGWNWVDPLMSIIVGVVVLVATWGLLRDAVNLALAAVPRSVDVKEVGKIIANYPTVKSYHDLHIWAVSTTDTALTVHLERTTRADNDKFISNLSARLRRHCAIDHITIQIECGDYAKMSAMDNNY